MKRLAILLPALALCGLCQSAVAQQDLEPGVQTSPAIAPSVSSPAPVSAAAPTSKPAAKPAASPKSGAAPTAQAAPKADKAADRVDLNATQISGNRELPKVMYVVPWRKAELGDFAGRPPNSLLDEALTPIDRDVFKRQNRYFTTLQQQAAAAKSQPDAPSGAATPPRPEDEK